MLVYAPPRDVRAYAVVREVEVGLLTLPPTPAPLTPRAAQRIELSRDAEDGVAVFERGHALVHDAAAQQLGAVFFGEREPGLDALQRGRRQWAEGVGW
jgi:hypothetical protein